MLKMPAWIIVVIVLNIAALLILLRPNPNVGIPSLNIPASNEPGNTSVLNQTVNQASNVSSNGTNQTFNASVYNSKCLASIKSYVKTVRNITNFTTVETRFFNDTNDAVNYVTNLSNRAFELMGAGKDIYVLNGCVVSLNDFTSGGNNFTLPIVCDESGVIGNYSSCIIANISNITSYCHNLTESVSECDLEKSQHDFWEDINYWLTPKAGSLNKSQEFNFTITSSRNMLEYATLNIYYTRPPTIYQNLFNESVATSKGDVISITTNLNLTGKTFGGLVVETYFKKKCYKYTLISQYNY